MKLKEITAVALIAALLTANISVTGFADTGAAAGNPDSPIVASPSNANQKFENESSHRVADPNNANKKVKNKSSYRVASPSDADTEPENGSGSDADRVVAVAPGKIDLPETLGLDENMKNAFEALLNLEAYQGVLEGNAERFIEQEQYKKEIAELFPNADKIQVSIEVELKKVVMGDDGCIQYVQYSAAPKVCGYKKDSLLGTRKLDGSYRIGDGNIVQFPIPEQYIAEDAREGSYMIRDGNKPYYGVSGDHIIYGYVDDYFGEVTSIPSRWSYVDEEYLHTSQLAEGEWTYWFGIDNLPKGTSVRVSFDGYPIHEIENPSKEYFDCKMSSDGKSMIITGKKVTDGENKGIYLIRKLKGGLELKFPFLVEVVDAPQNSGSSSGSSSDGGSSHSTSSSGSESSGSWQAGEKGWWFRYKDGTYPSNGWNLLAWQGKISWYYFNADGYMASGWLTDADGNRYFLHDQQDGTQGYMYTGWHEIDGKWYYFSEAEGGPLGSLVVNATTPDGYQVGADGAWIQ